MRCLKALLVALLVTGCAQSEFGSDEQPLDEEFGMVDWGKADNNSVVRPGTPEAEAVLAYVNQTLNDDREGARFEADLDAGIHVWAAANIAEFRAGADGAFGTTDDQRFDDLDDLDAVAWVGRATMQQLFVLAEAAGYFVTTSRCDSVAGNHITTLAQLIEIENSRCDFFQGDVKIEIEGSILPQHRTLKAFDNVRKIEGELEVTYSRGLEKAVFRGLREVGTIDSAKIPHQFDRIEFPSLTAVTHMLRVRHTERALFETVEYGRDVVVQDTPETFPNLTKAGWLSVFEDSVVGYDQLREVNALNISSDVEIRGFSSLETAGTLSIEAINGMMRSSAFPIQGFESLRDVDVFEMRLPETPDFNTTTLTELPALERVGKLDFPGNSIEFPALTSAGVIKIAKRFRGNFPVLTAVDRIYVEMEGWRFPALEEIREHASATGVGPARPSVLREVGASFHVEAALSSFDDLERVGTSLALDCTGVTWSGLDSLTAVNELTIDAVDCDFGGLGALETVPGPVNVKVFGNSPAFDPLPNLVSTGDLVYVDQNEVTQFNVLPSLELVDGFMRIHRVVTRGSRAVGLPVTGFDALTTINGELMIYYASELQGLGKVESIGGHRIGFPRTMSSADRDRFLMQLQQFSGDIVSL